jgi:ABC-type dipeptide/oligopeptide/nickel transport system ATPase component
LKKLRRERKMAILLITHNMGLVAEMCDRVAVMHGGKIVEMAGVQEIFSNPRHTYTRELLKSIPTLESEPKQALSTVAWEPSAEERVLPLVAVSENHFARVQA